MDNIFLVVITTFIIAIILVGITFLVTRRKSSKRYKEKVEELDIEKNQLINVKILSEITKVRGMVKTDNLKHKLDEWDGTFSYIKDKMLPTITDEISEVDFLIDKHDYKGAVKKMAGIELEIDKLRRKSQKLIEEIQIITNSEERNRALITKLKVTYRELQGKFSRCEKEYGELVPRIQEEFDKLDNQFLAFENAMDNNDYVEVEKIVIVIEEELNKLKDILDNISSLLLMASVLIPGKIEEAKVLYGRMQRDGYPMDYLNVEYNLEEITKKTEGIMNNIRDLKMEDANIELKTILDYFNSLFADFDKEKECKDSFKEGCKKFRYKLEKVNKVVYDIYVQIDDIRVTYDLTDAEINRFSTLNRNLEAINDDFKRLLEQGKLKTFAYSKLYDELDGLGIKLSRLQDDLDYQLKSITSMQDDEYRAKEQLNTIQDLLKKAKMKLKDYKLPVIPSSYYVELKEAQDAIREIVRELDKKPIVIKILNIRVDTARDLVFKIYNNTNDMIKASQLSEKMILYGNRYRSTYSEVDQGLERATMLFYKGQYEQSLEVSMQAISLVEENPISKIK
ncbi:MAG: septation ring formation regulator EzrA [Bacilli bacterium]|nr:septation ring formation regulator EzrA [Bacilli bacterium]